MIVGGIPIIQSLGAVERVRNRRYPKRKAKSVRHWQRMDKKYAKRFGYFDKPCMYRMAGGAFGRETFVVHPALMSQLRAALSEGEKP